MSFVWSTKYKEGLLDSSWREAFDTPVQVLVVADCRQQVAGACKLPAAEYEQHGLVNHCDSDTHEVSADLCHPATNSPSLPVA